MGIDYNADLGYGVKIEDKELISKLSDDIVVIPKTLGMMWSGDAYSDRMITFIAVKASVQSSCAYDNHDKPIKPEKLIVSPEWTTLITDWCKENGITKPKIGWWLCSSIS